MQEVLRKFREQKQITKEEELAEISSDDEEEEEVMEVKEENLEAERLKKDLDQCVENEIHLCPVGSCTFSLQSQQLHQQIQHFKQFHYQLDFSQLSFLTL